MVNLLFLIIIPFKYLHLAAIAGTQATAAGIILLKAVTQGVLGSRKSGAGGGSLIQTLLESVPGEFPIGRLVFRTHEATKG